MQRIFAYCWHTNAKICKYKMLRCRTSLSQEVLSRVMFRTYVMVRLLLHADVSFLVTRTVIVSHRRRQDVTLKPVVKLTAPN